MADSVNRIVPSTIAPERYTVSRRERDKNRKEPQQKDSDKPKAFPLFPATDAVDNEGESSKDKTKEKSSTLTCREKVRGDP
jgi:hypothetical protein